MMKLNRIEQSGRSMVEMLGVLAIIGVLSVGGIAGYSKAMTKFKINKSMDQISMLVANIRTLFSGQRNYSGQSLPMLLPVMLHSARPALTEMPMPDLPLNTMGWARRPV